MPHCSHHYSVPMGEIKRQNTKITQKPHSPCVHHWSPSLFTFDSTQQNGYQQPKPAQLCLFQATDGRSKWISVKLVLYLQGRKILQWLSIAQSIQALSFLGCFREKSVWVCSGVFLHDAFVPFSSLVCCLLHNLPQRSQSILSSFSI